ncbi:PadR family transcriptional regulator [Candidatus Micrarchaeota archaeon]|nr:PadR family transcriptional regulator [Candidatus Micrarchaeota archaeon]
MRGYLTFLILWIVRKKSLSGAEISEEIAKRKGCKPNPGTIYPALKDLVKKKALSINSKKGKEKCYSLTPLGKEVLDFATKSFCKIFYDVMAR